MKTTCCFGLALVVCGFVGGATCARGQTGAAQPPAAGKNAAALEMRLEKVTLKHCQPAALRTALQTVVLERSKLNDKAKLGELRMVPGLEADSLILRGSAADLALVKELIAALDLPEEKLVPASVQGVRLLPVTGDRAEKLGEMLEQLGISSPAAISLGSTAIYVFAGDSSEVADLLKILDPKATVAAAPK